MRNAPPPERYALYGNLQILPRPTAYPMQAKRKEAREPHDSLSAIATEQLQNSRIVLNHLIVSKNEVRAVEACEEMSFS